mmetsp:Transcript_1829/g.8166  ORF Transcript_1829/g.8166 Transcript_1829/m.8166 type:complete len:203 (+) Transcript_1829:3207-3815(+)
MRAFASDGEQPPATTSPAARAARCCAPGSESLVITRLSRWMRRSIVPTGASSSSSLSAPSSAPSAPPLASFTGARGRSGKPLRPTCPTASAAVPASVGFLHPATATNTSNASRILSPGNVSVRDEPGPAPPAAATYPAARNAPSWSSKRPCVSPPALLPPTPAVASSRNSSATAASGASRGANAPHILADTLRVGPSTADAK